MTTESSAAQSTFGEPCRDSTQYGKFIDALYVLVYEGSGSCKRLPTPPPDFAMDIKFLRTGIRHDVDHGDATSIRKKRLQAGEVFEKFSGKKTPDECGPDEFISTQIRMLQTLLGFLHKLP